MKAHAATFALLMIASSLAGCTTAGTDGVPEVTLDDDDIETFLDDYFQDFVNNSSVVINQEIHYHNNTTVNEGDDSSIRHYNGSATQVYPLHLLDIVFDVDSIPAQPIEIPDPRNNTFSMDLWVYDHDTGDMIMVNITAQCSDYYLFADSHNRTYWDDSIGYWEAWNSIYNSTYSDELSHMAWQSNVLNNCNPDYMVEDYTVKYEHTITIPEGYVFACVPSVGSASSSYQMNTFQRSEHWRYGGYGPNSWLQNSGASVIDTSTGSERNAYMTYSAVAGDLPHYCTRYAGDGSETDLVFTFEFDILVEMRFVLFYQLIPVDNLMA